MARLLGNPKALALLILVGVVLVLGVAGGALGNQFGGGFLGAPIAHIQLPAEPVSASPIVGDFRITNTMVAAWVAIAFLAAVSFFGTRRLKDVPGRFQNVLEVIIEFFLNLTENIAGPERGRRFFPLVMTIFLFIVTANWMGILPGYGTIGRFEPATEVIHHAEQVAKEDNREANLSEIELQLFDVEAGVAFLSFGSVRDDVTAEIYEESGDPEGKRSGLLVPFLRSANTDINTTLAIALVAMVLIHWWGFRALGILGHAGKYINFKAGPIGLFVGILEAISEIARVISFTFRLFGNIFAGEVLLIAMAFLVPVLGLVPFLGLELFVGLIQAFIFSMLTLVFAATATVAHNAQEH